MPQKGQLSITLSKKNIPKRIDILVNEYQQSLSKIVTMCIIAQYGNKKERKKAQKYIEVFGR